MPSAELAVWLDTPDKEPNIMSDLRFEIDRMFREKRIEIPVPQREVRVRGQNPFAASATAGRG
jgi:small-conductance mechanosensitive channel